jgi:hypothetical protein
MVSELKDPERNPRSPQADGDIEDWGGSARTRWEVAWRFGGAFALTHFYFTKEVVAATL